MHDHTSPVPCKAVVVGRQRARDAGWLRILTVLVPLL